MHTPLRKTLLGLVVVASAAACADVEVTESEPALEAHTASIVNGQNESGYPAVGSLVLSQFGLRQSFCTGTLITPNWVVTAAHCAKGMAPANVSFFIGAQVSTFGGSGQTFQAAELITHPRYDDTNPIALLHDIALMRLATAVPESVAKPYPYNKKTLTGEIGKDVTYVGFGATEGVNSSGSGTKRRTAVPISRVDPITYSLEFNGTGVCFGDSGGPGLLEIDGETRVISVVSTGNGCAGDGCDPCQEAGSNHTRVDAFADWIADVIGDDFPTCTDDLGVCDCPAACQESGVCDDIACATASCKETLRCIEEDCMDGADGSCAQACVHKASPEAQSRLSKYFKCWLDNCNEVPEAETDACLMEKCGDMRTACDAPAGTNRCDAAFTCWSACTVGDTACTDACTSGATADAQPLLTALGQCADMQCAAETGQARVTCLLDKCATQYRACMPSDHCNPVANPCPVGLACVAGKDGKTRCEPTGGVGDGKPCDKNKVPTDCDDGLRCVTGPMGDVCRPVCSADKPCASGTCDMTAYPEIPTIGVCTPGTMPDPGMPDGGTTEPDGGTTEPDGGTTEPDAGPPPGNPSTPDSGTGTVTDPIMGGADGGGKSDGGCSVGGSATHNADLAVFGVLAMFGLALQGRRKRHG